MKPKIDADTLIREGMEPKGTIVLLTRLAKVVKLRSTEELLGMRFRHFVLLSTLRDRSPAPQQNLCEMLWLDPNNLVLLLNELEADGYVERRRDPSDRRRHVVNITPAGLRALERAEHGQESLEHEVLAALSPDERATLRRLLLVALEGAPAEKASGAGVDAGAAAVNTPAA